MVEALGSLNRGSTDVSEPFAEARHFDAGGEEVGRGVIKRRSMPIDLTALK